MADHPTTVGFAADRARPATDNLPGVPGAAEVAPVGLLARRMAEAVRDGQ